MKIRPSCSVTSLHKTSSSLRPSRAFARSRTTACANLRLAWSWTISIVHLPPRAHSAFDYHSWLWLNTRLDRVTYLLSSSLRILFHLATCRFHTRASCQIDIDPHKTCHLSIHTYRIHSSAYFSTGRYMTSHLSTRVCPSRVFGLCATGLCIWICLTRCRYRIPLFCLQRIRQSTLNCLSMSRGLFHAAYHFSTCLCKAGPLFLISKPRSHKKHSWPTLLRKSLHSGKRSSPRRLVRWRPNSLWKLCHRYTAAFRPRAAYLQAINRCKVIDSLSISTCIQAEFEALSRTSSFLFSTFHLPPRVWSIWKSVWLGSVKVSVSA